MARGKYRKRHSTGEENGEPEQEMTWAFDDDDIKGREEDEVTPGKMVDAYFERQALENEAGRDETVSGFWGVLYRIMEFTSKKTPHARVKKSVYLILLVLLGWMGGHRYYEKRYYVGLLYTAFCWTGIPFIMCVIDAMIVIPKKPGEDGKIQM